MSRTHNKYKKIKRILACASVSLAIGLSGCAALPQENRLPLSDSSQTGGTAADGITYTDTDKAGEASKAKPEADHTELKILSSKENNASLPSIRSAKPGKEQEKTLLIYMVASDLESNIEWQNATRDLTEILNAGFDCPQANLVVYAGGTTAWWNGLPAEQNCYLAYNHDTNEFDIYADEKANMAASEVLSGCLNTVKEKFPAKEYEIIFWDHGAGPLEGYGNDTRFDPQAPKNINMLSVEDICRAFEEAGFDQKPFAWIGFDACLMGSLEVLSAMKPYTDTLIAAPETEPGSGWNYQFLSEYDLSKSPEDISSLIVNYYGDSLRNKHSEKSNVRFSLAAYDLSKAEALQTAVDDLFVQINSAVEKNAAEVQKITEAAGKSWNYGYKTGFELIDLGQFVSLLPDEYEPAANKVKEAIGKMIFCGQSNLASTTGMSFYLPVQEKNNYEACGKAAVASLQPSKALKQYIDSYANEVWGSTQAPTEIDYEQQPAAQVTDRTATYQIPRELQGEIASVSITLFQKTMVADKLDYCAIMEDLPAEFDEDGNIVVNEDLPVAVSTGSDAAVLSSCYIQADGNKQFYRTAVSSLSTSERYGDYGVLPACITFLYDSENNQTVFDSLRIVYGGKSTVFSALKSDIAGEDYRGFRAYIPWSNTLNEQEKLRPYHQKENNGIFWHAVAFDDHFAVEVVPLSRLGMTDYGYHPDFAYQLNAKDFQGNEYTIAFKDLEPGQSEKTIATEKGTMTFYVDEEQAVLVEYEGEDTVLEIPQTAEGKPVTMIKHLDGEKLEQIVLPDSVEKLGSSAFDYLRELQSVKLSSKLTEIPDRAFMGCEKLQTLEIPESVRSIGPQAFDHSGLQRIKIPASVKTIGELAFANCTQLTEIEFGKGSLFSIDGQFILDQNNTRVIAFLPGISEWQWSDHQSHSSAEEPSEKKESEDSNGIPHIIIPNFDEKTEKEPAARMIVIPDGVTDIADGAFAESVQAEKSWQPIQIRMPQGLKTIGAYAFYLVDLDMNMTLPDSLEKVGTFAFGNFFSFKEEPSGKVVIGPNLKRFGYASFGSRKKLIYELDPDNPYFTIQNNEIYTSSGDAKIALDRTEDDPFYESE